MQGDIWDAQKDMLMAFIGSIVTMFITMAINWGLRKDFGKEFKESLRIPKGDKPLGEVKIAEMLRRR